MLDEEAIRSLELKIREQREQLTGALAVDIGDGKIVELDQTRIGRLSRMDAMAQKEMSRATRARMQTELRRVDAAIARLQAGRYGVCCLCQDDVEINRLQSDPATPFCLPCLEEMCEARERGGTNR
jgi:DnaK suppressor protein